jgi:uncharacterized protein YcbX
MRTAGFPCRLLGCDRAFQVVDQKSMSALTAASAARSAHEVSAHDYHHVRNPDEPSYSAYARTTQRPAAAK